VGKREGAALLFPRLRLASLSCARPQNFWTCSPWLLRAQLQTLAKILDMGGGGS
jgi:hypothetical protein